MLYVTFLDRNLLVQDAIEHMPKKVYYPMNLQKPAIKKLKNNDTQFNN